MTAELKELEVVEVSLVDAGANPEADVLIFKAAEMMTCPECEAKMPAGAKECAKCGYEMKSKKSDEQKAAEPRKEQAMEMEKLAADLKAANEKLEAAEKRVKELEGEVSKRQTPEEIEKAKLAAVPEEIRKRLEAAEAEISKSRDEKETAVFVAKAKDLAHLPVKAEEFALVMKAAAKSMTAEQSAELDRVLKAADEALKPLFGSKGSDAKGGDNNGVFAQKVAKYRADGMKPADALQKAASEDPAGYNEYRSGTYAARQ